MELDWPALVEATQNKVKAWIASAVVHLPDFVAAVLMILIAGLLARVAASSLRRILVKAAVNDAVTHLIVTLARVSVVAVGLFIALGILDLTQAVTSLLAGAGIIGLALGFAFQDLAENLIAGIFLGIRKPFRTGDLIETNGQLGFVQTVNLRNTIIHDFFGQRILIPNKKAFSEILKNYSSSGRRRVDVDVRVGYDADLDRVTEVLRGALEGVEERLDDPSVQVVSVGFGSSFVEFSGRFWIRYPGVDWVEARHRGILAVKRALDAEGISIPFPARSLDFEPHAARRALDDAVEAEH